MNPLDAALIAAGVTAAGEIAIAASVVGWRRRPALARGPGQGASAPNGPRRRPADGRPCERSVGGRGEHLSRHILPIRAVALRREPLSAPGSPLRPSPRPGAGLLTAAAGWLAIWFLRIPAGGWTPGLAGLAGAWGFWYALGWLQARQEAEFVRVFPEIVDQVVRLRRGGVPSMEALAVVTEDAPNPVAPILREVSDGLAAGLDADLALRAATERIRMAEFTMFAAVIRMQRRSGGGVSTAFSNLSRTLRERRQTALKAHASTAQSRVTLLVLSAIPVLVLLSQSFIAPASIDVLFGTDEGATLLQVGVGLIVAGIFVARAIVVRSSR